MSETERDWSLWAVFAGAVVAIAALGFGLVFLMQSVCADDIAAGLTNAATVGGLVSGLSLSGTSVLALSGTYTKRVLDRFGSLIRVIFFGGFTLLIAVSLLCAVSVMWAGDLWTRYVLAFSVSLMFVTLILTALLINNAFKWEQKQPPEKGANPYKSQR